MNERPPIDVAHLLPVLDRHLLELLRSLGPAEWNAPTIARLWNVKDVVAHLLDGNIRLLSMLRDGHFGAPADTSSYEALVGFLNRLNADWVAAMKRVSPEMLVLLHEVTGPLFCAYFRDLDPFAPSVMPVAWAGESESRNWMETARQYTEKWLHQQQVRAAVDRPGLMTRELYFPFLDIFMRALPHTYRAVAAPEGTLVRVTVGSDAGGSWDLQRGADSWSLTTASNGTDAEVILSADDAWKLFSKSLRPADVQGRVTFFGDRSLAETALHMVSVMA